MSLIASDVFETRAAQLVATIMLVDEEQRPIDGDPPPAALVARCLYDLAQAAAEVGRLGGHWTPDNEDEDPSLLLRAAVQFGWVAVGALTAAARIHPEAPDARQPRVKAALLGALDEDAGAWVENREDYEDLEPGFWLSTVTGLFTGAAEGVAELEGCSPRPAPDWHPGGEHYGRDCDRDEIAEEVADALCQAAAMAANAAQWFEERHCGEHG